MSTKPIQTEESPSEQSFLQEQAEYWKSFLADLFIGTLKRMIISPLAFGLAFAAIAYLVYRLGIQPQRVFFLIKWLEILLLFLIYLPVGIVTGLAHGANSTLLKKTGDVERGVHLIINPVMQAIIRKLPGGQAGIGVEEFNALLDEQILRVKRSKPFRWRFWSLLGVFSRLFVRMTLRILRYVLLHDFLEYVEEQEPHQINAQTVEIYQREKLIGSLVGILTGNMELAQKVIYGILIVFLALPVLLLLIF